jgi:hypothetical protein
MMNPMLEPNANQCLKNDFLECLFLYFVYIIGGRIVLNVGIANSLIKNSKKFKSPKSWKQFLIRVCGYGIGHFKLSCDNNGLNVLDRSPLIANMFSNARNEFKFAMNGMEWQ